MRAEATRLSPEASALSALELATRIRSEHFNAATKAAIEAWFRDDLALRGIVERADGRWRPAARAWTWWRDFRELFPEDWPE